MLILKNDSSSQAKSTTLFHLVDLSPWPFVASQSLFIMLSGAVIAFHGYQYGSLSIKIGAILLVISASLWWRDVTREGFQGQHTAPVTKGIKMGFSLFIVSEIFLFIAFFWALFHSSLVPNIELGNVWPPLGVEPINPWVVPLLNAIILLSSGVTVTWAHHAIIAGNYKSALYGLSATIFLAVVFTALMVAEYYIASFDISDSVYGSCFYMLTGLHGSHIIVAIIFLAVSAYRLYKHHFSNLSFLGAELGILYYHFVDVVFLFVFGLVYWWSSGIELSLLDGNSIHAFAPLVFFNNKIYPFIKKCYKKTAGLYIKFLRLCLTNFLFLNVIFVLAVLPFSDLNGVTLPMLIFVLDIFVSSIAITMAIQSDYLRFQISDISGISEAGLLEAFTLRNSLRIAGLATGGALFVKMDDLAHHHVNLHKQSSYVQACKNSDVPVDPAVIRQFHCTSSPLTKAAENLPSLLGKSGSSQSYSFEDLKNNKKH